MSAIHVSLQRSPHIRRWGGVIASLVGGALVSAAAGQPAPAAPSSTTTEVLLGMSTALTGTTAGLGTDMRAGVEAAFAEVNHAGGIKGRTVRLIAMDDGYEPSRTGPNMRQLVEHDHVLAIIGNVGTPTAVVAIPIAQQSGTAFFGAFTGAGVLRRTPPDRCIINYRASYAEETAAMVGALIENAGVRPDEIAFFTQRDAYGDSGFNGGITALKSKGLRSESSVPHGRYDRNTDAVEDAVAEILATPTPPKAIIMVGTAQPSAKFVRLVRAAGINALMLSVSFVGSSQLAAQLGKEGEDVVVGRVVPPQTADLPIIREFRAAVTNESMRSREVVLEGYIVGRIMCRALATIDGEPTRDRIIAALEGLGRFDLGLGAPLTLSSTCHQACSRVWATRLHNGSVQSIEWSALKSGAPSAITAEEQR